MIFIIQKASSLFKILTIYVLSIKVFMLFFYRRYITNFNLSFILVYVTENKKLKGKQYSFFRLDLCFNLLLSPFSIYKYLS